MAIELNTPYVLANTQKIVFSRVSIENIETELRASLWFDILNEAGKRIGTKTYSYVGDDFNTFWTNFNTGKFLYDEFARQESLEIDVPETVETEFTNTQPEG
jgi:hypothetical protein